ncbi:hypothetical protein GY45DRAFT_961371 [Cubamyces sp. BRFM 1775]|nr:hypothetical protein GY45DRAFT_961371 [Cubamyces sp. BRFM 1775]
MSIAHCVPHLPASSVPNGTVDEQCSRASCPRPSLLPHLVSTCLQRFESQAHACPSGIRAKGTIPTPETIAYGHIRNHFILLPPSPCTSFLFLEVVVVVVVVAVIARIRRAAVKVRGRSER